MNNFDSGTHFDTLAALLAFSRIYNRPDSQIKNINQALRPQGELILTAVNGLAMIRRFTEDDVKSGRFDPLTMAETCPMEYETANGKKTITIRERGFVPTELVMLFRQAGFIVEYMGGGTAGKWGKRPLDLDEIEIMVIAHKAVV